MDSTDTTDTSTQTKTNVSTEENTERGARYSFLYSIVLLQATTKRKLTSSLLNILPCMPLKYKIIVLNGNKFFFCAFYIRMNEADSLKIPNSPKYMELCLEFSYDSTVSTSFIYSFYNRFIRVWRPQN